MIVNLLIIIGFCALFVFVGYSIADEIKDKDNIPEKFKEYLKDKNKI